MANRLRIDMRGADDYSAFPFVNGTFVQFAFDMVDELKNVQCFFRIKNKKSQYFILAETKKSFMEVTDKIYHTDLSEILELLPENISNRGNNKIIIFSEVY